jgi:hypothetical protein
VQGRRAGRGTLLCGLFAHVGIPGRAVLVDWNGGRGRGERGTFTTWLRVVKGVGVEENLRAIEGVMAILGLGVERGRRTEGVRNLRRSKTAIVGCGRRNAVSSR